LTPVNQNYQYFLSSSSAVESRGLLFGLPPKFRALFSDDFVPGGRRAPRPRLPSPVSDENTEAELRSRPSESLSRPGQGSTPKSFPQHSIFFTCGFLASRPHQYNSLPHLAGPPRSPALCKQAATTLHDIIPTTPGKPASSLLFAKHLPCASTEGGA